MFKLYNIQESLSVHAEEIKNANEQLVGLREEQRACEEALEETRTEQARQRTDAMQKEKRLKKAEKIGLRKINVSNSKKTHPYPLPGSEFVAANHLVPDHADNFAIGKFAFESLGAI